MSFLKDYKKNKKKIEKLFGLNKPAKKKEKKTEPEFATKSRTFSIKTKMEILPGTEIEIDGNDVSIVDEDGIVGTVSDAACEFMDESEFDCVFDVVEKNKVKITIEYQK